jgi:hypothetical protein
MFFTLGALIIYIPESYIVIPILVPFEGAMNSMSIEYHQLDKYLVPAFQKNGQTDLEAKLCLQIHYCVSSVNCFHNIYHRGSRFTQLPTYLFFVVRLARGAVASFD